MKGEYLAACVSRQQAIKIESEEQKLKREERRRQEEARRSSAEDDERREEARRRHEMEMKRFELEASAHAVRISDGGARGPNLRLPKVPVFADGRNDLDTIYDDFRGLLAIVDKGKQTGRYTSAYC